MEITGNLILETLGLPEWDARVTKILDFIGEKRPKDEMGLGQVIVTPKDYGIILVFSHTIVNNKQRKTADSGALFLRQISFETSTSFSLPFDISYKDSAAIISEKIHLKTQPLEKYIVNTGIRYFLQNVEGTQYFLDLGFNNERHDILEKFIIKIYNDQLDYSSYEPYKVNL